MYNLFNFDITIITISCLQFWSISCQFISLHPALHRNGAQRGSAFTFLSVVCCLYVTFLLPLERAPKVLTPSSTIKEVDEDKKNEKICLQRTKNNQASSSKTEATLILCGYSGERANNRGDRTIKEEVRRRKIRKFAYRQSKNNQTIKEFKH